MSHWSGYSQEKTGAAASARANAVDDPLEGRFEGLPVRGGRLADHGDPPIAREERGTVAEELAAERLAGGKGRAPAFAKPLRLDDLGIALIIVRVIFLHLPHGHGVDL